MSVHTSRNAATIEAFTGVPSGIGSGSRSQGEMDSTWAESDAASARKDLADAESRVSRFLWL